MPVRRRESAPARTGQGWVSASRHGAPPLTVRSRRASQARRPAAVTHDGSRLSSRPLNYSRWDAIGAGSKPPRPIVLPVSSSAFSAREVRTAPDTGALDPALGFDALRTLLLRSLRALLLFVVLVRGRRLARYGASVGRGDPSCGVDHPFRGRPGRAQSPDRGKRGKERDRQSTRESYSQPRACPAPLCANALGEGDNKFGTRLRSRPPQLILDLRRFVPTPEPFH